MRTLFVFALCFTASLAQYNYGGQQPAPAPVMQQPQQAYSQPAPLQQPAYSQPLVQPQQAPPPLPACPVFSFTQNVITETDNVNHRVIFTANTPHNVAFVDVHYRVNNGELINLRMTKTNMNNIFEQAGIVMNAGDNLTYFFTYCVLTPSGNVDCDSDLFQFTKPAPVQPQILPQQTYSQPQPQVQSYAPQPQVLPQQSYAQPQPQVLPQRTYSQPQPQILPQQSYGPQPIPQPLAAPPAPYYPPAPVAFAQPSYLLPLGGGGHGHGNFGGGFGGLGGGFGGHQQHGFGAQPVLIGGYGGPAPIAGGYGGPQPLAGGY